jgi:hypothetical protein
MSPVPGVTLRFTPGYPASPLPGCGKPLADSPGFPGVDHAAKVCDPFGIRTSYNEGVRKRRWWFAGLALTLLAACVGVWKWNDRPPFKFMEGAILVFEKYDDGGDFHGFRTPRYAAVYSISHPLKRVVDGAGRELRFLNWSEGGLMTSGTGAEAVHAFFWEKAAPATEAVTIYDFKPSIENLVGWYGQAEAPLPKGITGYVCVSRPPTILDRVRVWVRSLGRGSAL